ncbi:AAA domain-containing protein [Candidatus Poriferisocius sp.]|uniref:AAA domain-containing protein n=1 Tax=Candidatus Poriferisocius sp. TaxID=3101276 RepID=UPI003B590264
MVDFLAAFDAQKNPPVHDISSYGLFKLDGDGLPDVSGVRLTPADSLWLTVDFVELPTRPAVPEHLDWLLGPAAELNAHNRPAVELPENPTEDDFALAEEAESWVTTTWEPWAGVYKDARAAKDLYRDLFEQRERLLADRDSLELVWGFGRLQQEARPGERIDHPLLTIPVEIEKDENTRQLSVRPAGAVEAESLFLADVEIDDREAFNAIRRAIADDESAIDLWDEDETRELLRRLTRAIDHEGGLAGEVDSRPGVALADESWTLFLRRRRPNYQGFLDDLRELYNSGAIPPDSLQAVVIDSPSTLVEDWEPRNSNSEPLLLPLASNEEQQRILQLAQHRPGVTVQGPPGTGKSHTIANIISHYVAYGRRVLVVAEKEQALRVLADKVPPEIRDLTVSVLGTDEEGRRRLESSIRQIQTRVSAIDRVYAGEQIRRLEEELDLIDRGIAIATDRLLSVRSSEVNQLPGTWAAGAGITPATAAKWLAENTQRLGYIPDALEVSTSAPFGASDLAEYVELLRRVGVERATSCAFTLPTLSELPTGSELSARFESLRVATEGVQQVLPHIMSWERIDAADPSLLGQLLAGVKNELDRLTGPADGWEQRLREQLVDPALVTGWQDFAARCRSEREALLKAGQSLEAHEIVVPGDVSHEFEKALGEAEARLREKGRLGIFAGDRKKTLEQCSVDGRVPATGEEVRLCLRKVWLDQSRRRLQTLWSNRVARIDGPALEGAVPEDLIGSLLERLEDTLNEGVRQSEIARALTDLGITSPPKPAIPDLELLRQVLELLPHRGEQLSARSYVQELTCRLAQGAEEDDASPLWSLLADAAERQDTLAWDQFRSDVEELTSIAPQAMRLRELHQALRGVAPIWAERIATNPDAAGFPAEFDLAWQWRQLRTWIDEIEGTGDPAKLQRELEELANNRRRTVTSLVSEMAWLRLADNVGDAERQALNSYLQAVRRYGRTGGKFAARWLAQIRTALNESKDAVPVWIMPTHRALTSFRPDATPRFDVLVIDESSQLGLEALPLLSLAKSTIVVGDNKQTSPENVGLNRQPVFDLLEQYLAGIPNYQTLFDPDSSLYDLAFQKFPDVVMLTEHFRSLPQIIQFSNLHAYDNSIVPLRDQLPRPAWPCVGAIKVEDGYREGHVNEPEAHAVVDLLAELCDDPDYDGMTFGVISLLATAQSKRIWDLLYERLGPDVILEREIRCGEPANFQGDERDVMIISTVVATDPLKPQGRIAAMAGLPAARRINVAASRARDQMWVVHSVEPDRFPNGDLRGELIRYCRNPGALAVDLDRLEEKCESEFERAVVREILSRGYRMVKVQYPVGRFRIDIVVEGPDARLAIEVDGDHWHGEDAWHRDRAREMVLERAGWTFERIRGSSFYLDRATALEPLWRRLEELGIPTGDEWISQPTASTVRSVRDAGASAADDEDTAEESLGGGRSAEIPVQSRAAWRPITGEPSGHENGPATDRGIGEARPMASPVETEIFPAWPTAAAEGTEARTDAPSTSHDRQPLDLNQFREWQPHALPELAFATQEEVVAGLVEIVSAEGPMHALRAYQLYAKAAGGNRVGKEMRRVFNRAVFRALRSGQLAQISDSLVGQIEKTLHLPDAPPVVLRERGSRRLYEIPRSEIKLLLETVGPLTSMEQLKRSALEALDMTKLTRRAGEYFEECLDYMWTPSSEAPDGP